MYYSYPNIPEGSFGGKADGLLSLSSNGFNVPPYYIFPNQTIKNIVSEKFSIKFLVDEWKNNVNPKSESLWAVRSSAEVEDGQNKSYAGIFSTELNCNIDNLETAFEKVLSSYKNVRSDSFAYNKIIDFGFNIVLQEMICGEISGVGFSINPMEQLSHNPIINIIPGLGPKLVSGEENAMMIELSKESKVISEDENYQGEVYNTVSGLSKISLTKNELFKKVQPYLKELRESLLKIDQLKGYPVDTEFTIYNGEIYWLQVRPVTALIPRGNYSVWDSSNMDVNYPGIVMPLTISFVQHSYSNAYISMCRFLGAGNSFIARNKSLFKNTVGAIKGGMYYNITSYQQLLYQMPFGKKTSRLFPKMIGAEEAKFHKPKQSSSVIAYLKLFLNLSESIVFFGNHKKKYLSNFNEIYSKFGAKSLKDQSHSDLNTYLKTLEIELGNYWHVPILNSLFSMMVYNGLTKMISHSKLQNDYPNFLNDSLMGSGQVISMEIVYALQDLTYQIHQNSDVKKIILEMESSEVLEHLKINYSTYFDLIMSYINKYGERSDEGELKIETVNYKEDPTKFVDFLKSVISVPQHKIPFYTNKDF